MKQREFAIKTENDKKLATQIHKAGYRLLTEARLCYAIDLTEVAIYKTTIFKLITDCGKQLVNTNFN